MKLLYQDKGRGYFGRSIENTFIIWSGPFLGWYWPWSKFWLYEDKVVLKIWPKTFELPFSKITTVKVQKFYDLVGNLKFNHNIAKYPKTFLFYSWDSEKIVTLLKQRGLKIEESKDGVF